MKKLFVLIFMTTCVAVAEPASLSWWLLPNSTDELPHEIEDDDLGQWSEIWLRPDGNAQSVPKGLMEQGPAVRWVGLNPDKEGKPGRVILVFADRRVVDLNGEQARAGTFDGEKISWADGTKQSQIEYRRRRARRGRRGTGKIKFGKISIPSAIAKPKAMNEWAVEGLERFLAKIPNATSEVWTPRDLSIISQLSDQNASILGFKYASSCDFEERQKIEDSLANQVEPKLTCWMEQNPEGALRLLSVLVQKPTIECPARVSNNVSACGSATVPLFESFFVTRPTITIAMKMCTEELSLTLLHEILHLAGAKEGAESLDKATMISESCGASPAQLNYENPGDPFLNEFQVNTRVFLFRKVRDEASSKWGWSTGERSFMLGSICAKMGDKYCARRYFKEAADSKLPGAVTLPEGGDVTLNTLAYFNHFDSITEDLPRMHELVHYLKRDPNGTLLRRLETESHRLHEFYVARSTLETIQSNKGVCNSETDDRVFCEDLAEIIKTPWFRNP